MAEEGFEVRGPHEEHLEHATEHGRGDWFASRIAITTALLATIGALFGYMAGLTQADATLYKTQAAIRTTKASDQWAYYQSKNSKEAIATLGQALVSADQKDRFTEDIKRYRADQESARARAQALEKEADEFDEKSDHSMHVHHRWAQGTTMLQIAIALAAIALLTRRTWLQWIVYAFSGIGIAIGITALALG